VSPIFVANDPAPLQGAMLCGEGLLISTDVSIKPFVESGRAVRVLAGWVGPEIDFNAVFTRGRVPSPKVRAFVDFLVERLTFDADYMMKTCPLQAELCDGRAVELPVVEDAPRKLAAVPDADPVAA
jgi:LysR family transcriptional regulator for bpeEF and oprC